MPTLPPVKQFLANDGTRIYRIPCRVAEEMTGRVHLLLGHGPPTLIDAGSGRSESVADILAGMERVRGHFAEPIHTRDVRRILFTHGHPDHIGGLRELLGHTKPQIGIHPLERRAVTAPKEWWHLHRRQMRAFLQQAGVEPLRRELLSQRGFAAKPWDGASVDLDLEDGTAIDGLRFIHTPGHAAGHVCMLAGDILICGDHLLSRTIPQQWPESFFPSTGLGHYFESLDKVRRIPGISLATGGHEPAICHVPERVGTIVDAQRRRLARLHDMMRRATHPLSIDEITGVLYSGKTGMWELLALNDVGARVEYLHERGLLAVANLEEIERQEQPVYRYRAT